MQSPPQPPPAPPLYSIPARSTLLPLWGKILLGCGALLIVFMLLAGIGITRLIASGRDTNQTMFCFRNLREAQRGLDLYSQDYDQTLPRSAAWMDALTPYVKKRTEFRCPVVFVANHSDFGYAFNTTLSGSQTSKIKVPSQTAEVYDSMDVRRNAADALISLPSPPRHILKGVKAAKGVPLRGNVILYADGHVRFAQPNGTSLDEAALDLRRPFFGPSRRRK